MIVLRDVELFIECVAVPPVLVIRVEPVECFREEIYGGFIRGGGK